MRSYAGAGNLAVWYSHLDMADVLEQIGDKLDQRRKTATQAALDKARSRDSVQALAKLTTVVDGRVRIVSQPPLIVPDGVKRDFYLRLLRDGKGSVVVEDMVPAGLAFYARSVVRPWPVPTHDRGIAMRFAAYLGSSDRLDQAIADFGETYADQNSTDHTAVVEAVVGGRVTPQTGI